MDQAAIFSEVMHRNALRRAHGLPLLDVAAEYGRQASVARLHDYQATCDEHADERETIRRQVLAECQAKHRRDFGSTMGGRWAISHLTRQRFAAHMAERYGVVPPDCPP